MIDIIKLIVIFFGYAVLAPVAGFMISKDQKMQDIACIFLIFLLGLHIDTTVLMVNSVEWYRGVTKGYEFTMMEVVAICMIFAAVFDPKKRFVFLPMGTIPWFVYIFFSSLSVFTAIEIDYVFMNILKFAKAWLIVYALANYIRDRKNLETIIVGLCIMILYQFIFVAKMKVIDGYYQIRGLFEHQNPLAMFTYMAALPILAIAMSPAVKRKLSLLCFITFGCACLIVYASLSRAALAVLAIGIGAVILVGFFDKISLRRFVITAAICLAGVFGLLMTIDTLVGRFVQYGNEASEQTRQVMNLAARAMQKQNMLGVGWNNFAVAINHPYPYGDVIDQWNLDRGYNVSEEYAKGVVESHYWLIKAENGLLAFCAYMFLIIYTWFRGLYLMITRRGRFEAALVSGILIAFALTYGHETLERVLTQTKNLALWLMFMGVLGAIVRLPRKALDPVDSKETTKDGIS